MHDTHAPGTGFQGSPQRGRSLDRGQIVGGLVLMGIGTMLLIGQTVDDFGRYIPLVVGVVFLLAFLFTREYGFLVPGGIVTGVGAGIILTSTIPGEHSGGLFLVSLGTGFVSIWLLGLILRVRENHPWPLIPGGILLTIGLLTLGGQSTESLIDLWPVILIAAGAVVLAQAFLRRPRP